MVAVAARTTLDALGVSRLRHECRNLASDCLVSVRGDSVLIVLGGGSQAHGSSSKHPAPQGSRSGTAEQLVDQAAMQVAGGLGGSAVVGPVVPGISHAGRSLRSALAGLRALPGWVEAPNPVHADDLLPERLLAGDELAGEQILSLVHAPLHEMGDPFESTVATYLALGGSLEATARTPFVHANTVSCCTWRSSWAGWPSAVRPDPPHDLPETGPSASFGPGRPQCRCGVSAGYRFRKAH